MESIFMDKNIPRDVPKKIEKIDIKNEFIKNKEQI